MDVAMGCMLYHDSSVLVTLGRAHRTRGSISSCRTKPGGSTSSGDSLPGRKHCCGLCNLYTGCRGKKKESIATRDMSVSYLVQVNFPAHLVIIKSTFQYVGSRYVECSELDILQMMGRAGRPQVRMAQKRTRAVTSLKLVV